MITLRRHACSFLPHNKPLNFSRISSRCFSFSIPNLNKPLQISLRPYQEECIQSCVDELENGSRRIAVSLPTGGGKTVIFSNLIERIRPKKGYGNTTLILVHRKELANQAAAMCKKVYPDKNVQIEMGKLKCDWDSKPDIIIGSVQTLIGRLFNYNPKDFKAVIIDECHHAVANSYSKILAHFNIKDKNSDIASIGFSATLRREDEKSLHNAYDKMVFHMNLENMINEKHLSDARFTTVRLEDSDLGKVKTRMGDFVIKGLSQEVNKPSNNEIVLRTFLKYKQDYNFKSALLFGIDIEHVTCLNELFNSRGVSSRCVTSKTNPQYRDQYVKEFKDGKISVLMNCGIFTEGTDIPNIDCILMVRPTKSQTLLVQMIGRGLRLHKDKEICHIIDFVGVNNSDIMSVPVLKNLPPDIEINGLTLTQMHELQQKREEEKKKLKEELEKSEQSKEKKKVEDDEKVLYSNLVQDIKGLELRTYDSLKDFISSKDGVKPDVEYILESSLPWVAGPTSNIWIIPSKSSKRNSSDHIALEIHPHGLRKSFSEEVDFTGVYKDLLQSEKISKLQPSKLYTLSYYKERDEFKHRTNFYQKRFEAKLIMPVCRDIRALLKSPTLLSDINGRSNLKFSEWRSKSPTERQMNYLVNSISKSINQKYSREFIEEFENEIKNHHFTAGRVSDLLASIKIFRSASSKKIADRLIKSYGLEGKAKENTL